MSIFEYLFSRQKKPILIKLVIFSKNLRLVAKKTKKKLKFSCFLIFSRKLPMKIFFFYNTYVKLFTKHNIFFKVYYMKLR